MSIVIAILVSLTNLFSAFGTVCPDESSTGCHTSSYVAYTNGEGEQTFLYLP